MPTYPNARAFLEAVVERYRSLSSYSDSGKSHRPNCRQERLCSFETDFRAPTDFRFAFQTPHPYRPLRHRVMRTVVGVTAGRPYFYRCTYSGGESLEHPEDLELTIAGATGISSGTVNTIASLLFGELEWCSLLALRRLRFRHYREIDNVRCVAITGHHPALGRCTAWFGAGDLLLRRIVRSQFRDEELRTVIQVGSAIPDARFEVPLPLLHPLQVSSS